jgi:hypothetical protein
MWLRYLTVAFVVVAFAVSRYFVDLDLVQSVGLGAVVGLVLAVAAKFIWAALNPLPRAQ